MAVADKYPFLKMTILTMASSIGALNRGYSEEQYLAAVDPILGAEGVYHEDLQKMNDFLGTLSEDEVLEVADGDVDRCKEILSRFPDAGKLNGLLNDIFYQG